MQSPTTFHYFLRDVCFLLVTVWTNSTTPAATAWAPATFFEAQVAKEFVSYLIECAPTTDGYLRKMHIAFISVLIQRWANRDVPIRPSFRPIIMYLVRPDNKSRATFSPEGAKIHVAVSAIYSLNVARVPPIQAS